MAHRLRRKMRQPVKFKIAIPRFASSLDFTEASGPAFARAEKARMSAYRDELQAAKFQGLAAYNAMEAWLNRPFDAPDVPAAVLEKHAAELRTSRERLRALVSREGNRDDIVAALDQSEMHHKALGLSIKDKPEVAEIDTDDRDE